jgi:hypothetical protein
MAEIHLKSGSTTLTLQVGNQGWTSVVLLIDEHKHSLGADTLSIIATRIINALEAPLASKDSGEIDGVRVRWVLSLSEQHHTIYLAVVNEGIKLFIQHPDTTVVGSILLSDSDIARWLESLRRCLLSDFDQPETSLLS